MTENMWFRLWDVTTSADIEVAYIIPSKDSMYEVTVVWSDKSTTNLCWQEGDWYFPEGFDTCPCDIGARL